VASAITARQGTIASGEKLLRDPAKLLAVRKQHGKIEAGEMEAAGIVDACRREPTPWLVIRGISDFGDEFKDDRFHGFAAAAAAAVLHDFLAYGLDLGHASSEARPTGPAALHPPRGCRVPTRSSSGARSIAMKISSAATRSDAGYETPSTSGSRSSSSASG
jgi:hypothetical protein